jgi:hypothetical protein
MMGGSGEGDWLESKFTEGGVSTTERLKILAILNEDGKDNGLLDRNTIITKSEANYLSFGRHVCQIAQQLSSGRPIRPTTQKEYYLRYERLAISVEGKGREHAIRIASPQIGTGEQREPLSLYDRIIRGKS